MPCISSMTYRDCIYQEKKEEADLPAFKIVTMYLYNDFKTT